MFSKNKNPNKFIRIIFLFCFVLFFCNPIKVFADYNYTVLNDCGSDVPVIFVFHGVGDSSKELDGGELAAYKLVKDGTINPGATMVYLRKGSGAWNSSTAASTVKNYISNNNITAPVYYYGFSMGALNGPDIISSCNGIFSAAVFVDEDFIYYNGGQKNGTADKIFPKLSSLKAIYTIRGNAGDTTANINELKTLCENAGMTFNDTYKNKTHAQMNSYAVTDGNAFGWLLSQDGFSPSSGNSGSSSKGGFYKVTTSSLPYIVYVPSSVSSNIPVFMFLHGNLEANGSTSLDGYISHYQFLQALESGSWTPNCVIICPKENIGSHWGSDASKLQSIISEVTSTYGGSSSNLYISGASAGSDAISTLKKSIPFKSALFMAGHIGGSDANTFANTWGSTTVYYMVDNLHSGGGYGYNSNNVSACMTAIEAKGGKLIVENLDWNHDIGLVDAALLPSSFKDSNGNACHNGLEKLIGKSVSTGTGGGKVDIDGPGYKNNADEQKANNGGVTGGKTIYYSSFKAGYVHYGENDKTLKYRLEYESNNGLLGDDTYPKREFLDWLFDVKGVSLDKDIYVYPDCIIFNESYNGTPYYCTGWLYLYCDSNRYLEYAENIAGIGDDYIPRYFTEEDKKGTMFITFPGEYFYYPVSNMIVPEYPNAYLTQIFPPSTDTLTDAEAAKAAMDMINGLYGIATKVHNINDFSGIYGEKDLLIAPQVIPKEYAWVFAFCNTSMCKNFTNNIGLASYNDAGFNFPYTKTELKKEIDNAIKSASFLQFYINYGHITGGGQYSGFKESAQTLGVDKIFSGVVSNGAASRVGRQKDRIMGWGNLLNCSSTLDNIFKNINSSTGFDDVQEETGNAGTVEGASTKNALNAKNIEKIYKESMVTSDIPAGFIKVTAGGKTLNIAARYVWSASAGQLMGDTDLNLGRDTASTIYNVSENLSNFMSFSISTLKQSDLTKSFASQGTDAWNDVSEDEKIKSTLLILETHPELLVAMAKNNNKISSNLGGTNKDILKRLNELGASDKPDDYQKWKDTLLEAGNFLYQHSLASNIPSNGWNSQYAFLRKTGNYYSLLHIGINVCQTEMVSMGGISDLVLANSYNKLPSNFRYESNSSSSSGGSSGSGGGFTTIVDNDVALDDSIGNTAYVLIGESHISMSETAVINNGGIQTLSNGNALTLGKDLFFIHTLYLNGTESKHNGSAGSYESLGNTTYNFAGAYPGWLNTDGFSYSGITDLAGQSAATRIKKIIDNNSNIDNWVFVILQGYTVSSSPNQYDSYKNELVNFSNTISNYTASKNKGSNFYFVGCVRNNDATINSNIKNYNDYLKTNLSGTNYTFYDWSDSWEKNYAFQDSNHLTYGAYYQIWNDHLGNEIRACSASAYALTTLLEDNVALSSSVPLMNSRTYTSKTIDTSSYGLSAENVSISVDNISNEYKIAWISDLHMMLPNQTYNQAWFNNLGMSFDDRIAFFLNSRNVLPNLVNCINNNDFDAVVFGGDIIDNFSSENLAYLQQYISQINKKVIFLSADHDYLTEMTTNSGANKAASSLGSVGGTIKQLNIGKNGDNLVLIGQNFSNEPISQSDYNTVQSILSSNTNTLYFTHVPLESQVNASGMQQWSRSVHNNQVYYWSANAHKDSYKPSGSQQSLMNSLYNASSLKGVFAGHMHASYDTQFSNTAIEHVFDGAFRSKIGVITVSPSGNVTITDENVPNSPYPSTGTGSSLKPNKGNSSGTTNKTMEVKYNPTARNVIDWMHNGPTADLIMVTNDGKPAFAASAIGGRSSIPAEITGTKQKNSTTELDLTSQWQRYDIGCGIVMDNSIVSNATNFKKDTNNTINVEINNNMASVYEQSKERLYYNTFVFVGRIPESDPLIEVNTSDFKIVATAKFNNYNVEEFDASYHQHQATQYLITQACKNGTAAEAMNVYFSSFQTDYNTQVLYKVYGDNDYYYQMSTGLKASVIAQPYAIQRMDTTSLANYKKEDYPEFGPNTEGYAGLKPVVTSPAFTNTNGDTDIQPGDVVAFQLAYFIPNDTTLEQDMRKNSATLEYQRSLYTSNEWYQKYGAVNMVDLDFQLVPAKGKEDKWTTINANSNNDWARERLNPPLMNNIFFTHADVKVDGAIKYTYDAPIVTIANNITASKGKDSTRETIFELSESDLFGGNAGGTTQYLKSKVQLNVKWRYWCMGKNATTTPQNTYNYLDYSNGFTGESSSTANVNDGTKVTAQTVVPSLKQADMTSNPNDDKLTLKLNQNVLNSAKNKAISVSVPNNSSNQFHEDWEVIKLSVKSPDKDNAAVDLVLTNGGTVLGNANVKRGGSSATQQLNQNYSNCVLYAVVRREAPSGKAWKELIKNTSSNNIREEYIPDAGALTLTLTINGGTPIEVKPSLVTKSIPGYTGKAIRNFINTGDYLVYEYSLPGEIKSLEATMDFRNKNDAYYDYEDSTISNNSWSEHWESTLSADYELSIIDGQQDVQKQVTGDCPPPELIKPWLNFTIAQLNSDFRGNNNVQVHVYIAETGEIPEEIHGVQYMGNGYGFKAFGSGASGPFECRAEFKERYVPYSQNSQGNKTYTINAHINYCSACKNDFTEINFENNYKIHPYTINLSCTGCSNCPTPTPCCVMGYLQNRDARTIYGLGQKYEWDVKFRWSQVSTNQTDSTNVYVTHYYDGCPSIYKSVSDGNGGTTTVLVQYIEHEHCPCYCSPQHYAANNGKRYWRNQELGLGLYYEYHDLRIYCWSSAHGLRDISGGSTVVYTGEEFYFYFDAIYASNRSSQPDAKHEPFSQPYATANGGSGCRQPCNVLSRYPNVQDVAGPRKVRITISGTQSYDMDKVYSSPQQILSNGAVNKHYRWKPIPDKIYVMLTNVNQKINLSICSYDFKGHWYDTWNSADGTGYSLPGYAWYNRDRHVFCGTRNATIYIRPSKPYIGTNPGSNGNGVDGTSPGNGGTPWADGDTWVQ